MSVLSKSPPVLVAAALLVTPASSLKEIDGAGIFEAPSQPKAEEADRGIYAQIWLGQAAETTRCRLNRKPAEIPGMVDDAAAAAEQVQRLPCNVYWRVGKPRELNQ